MSGLANQDDRQFLNQGQMKLARQFCLKLVPNVPSHVLDWMQKEPDQKELWFGNGNVLK